MMTSFIGIGAQKCGSTWLYQILAAHPEVKVPEEKEANFFSYRFDHGYQWYERLFGTNDAALHTGEVSPSYFHDPAAPARVSSYRPGMKILLTLRDPVQRAMSNHRHEVRAGHLTGSDLSFEAGLANNPMYIEQGLFAKHLRNWLAVFPAQQIHVVLLEDIESDPARVAQEVFRFLEIDDTFQPASLTRRYNRSIANRSHMLFRAKEHAYRISRKAGMGWLWSAATRIGARSAYRRLNTAERDDRVPPMAAASRRLLRHAFAADVRELEVLLGRSLRHWLKDAAADTATALPRRANPDVAVAGKTAP